MLFYNARKYEQNLGVWAQRLVGAILAATAVSAASAVLVALVNDWTSGKFLGPDWFSVLVLAAIPWCVMTAVRLLRARMSSEPLMSPVALIAFGVVFCVTTCLLVIAVVRADASLSDFDILEGFAIAIGAIGFGVRSQRRRSRG